MSTTPQAPGELGINALLSDVNALTQALSSPAALSAFVTREAQALGVPDPTPTDIWPVRAQGRINRLVAAHDPTTGTAYKKAMEDGRTGETDLANALDWVTQRKKDIDEKIQHLFNMNKLAVDGQLPDTPRAIKYAKDGLKFMLQVRDYMNSTLALLAAIEANIALYLAAEARMVQMINQNTAMLNELLNNICNWGLPNLPSLPSILGNAWHWNGFNFNRATGFNFLYNPQLQLPNHNFYFGQCIALITNFEGLFSPPSSISYSGVTASVIAPPPPLNGEYGDPTQYSDPGYITAMQQTTAAVIDPNQASTLGTTSLPPAAAIISNYSLTPASYAANIASVVPALTPIVIQASDPDFGDATPSAARSHSFRLLLAENVNLAQIVASGYDPNLTAAWLQYLALNRAGRGGSWLPNFSQAYATLIAPSLSYLADTPVPWNKVLGGNGVVDAPPAIPLIATLKADTTNHLLWQLSYIEASLLGYSRNTTWDSTADTTFLSGATGADLDYVVTTIDPSNTATTVVGVDTATYPVEATYPQAIASALSQVVALATANIAAAPTFQSSRPQFRFTYDTFAQASVVDRFTQFWREFSADLAAFLAGDAYVAGFAASYPLILNGTVNPLGDPTAYQQLVVDAGSRNRSWTPGSVLPPIPKAMVVVPAFEPPTAQNNGWSSGSFDPVAFLARPDVQAQPLPVQIAMMRTSQSISALADLQITLQNNVAQAIADSRAVAAQQTMLGWDVQTASNNPVPANHTLTLDFATVNLDKNSFVTNSTTVTSPVSGPFVVCVSTDWSPTSEFGVLTVKVLQNGTVIASAAVTSSSGAPVQVTTQLTLNQGDVLQVQVSHDLPDTQTLLSGATFLGLLDPTAT